MEKKLDPLASLNLEIFSDEEHKELAKKNVKEIKNLDELNLVNEIDKGETEDKEE